MFVKAFVLLVGLSTAYTLKCYLCLNEKYCTRTLDCGQTAAFGMRTDRCFSAQADGVVAKGCINHEACVAGVNCCVGDLCNGTAPTGPTVVLLLLSSAIFTMFL